MVTKIFPFQPMHFDDIASAIPKMLTDIGRLSIIEFLALPNSSEWTPARLGIGEIGIIFNAGLPFALIGDCPSAQAHKAAISACLMKPSVFPKEKIAEVDAAAILSHMGAKVEFIPTENGKRTPDLVATWAGDEKVSVEVTSPLRAEAQKLIDGALADFAGAVRCGDIDGEVYVYFADASDRIAQEQALEALVNLRPGERISGAGWFVAATPKEWNGSGVPYPDWWDAQAPNRFSSQILIGNGFPLRVHCTSQIPLTTRIKALTRKADRPQGQAGKPFLIAVDVTDLTRAHLPEAVDDVELNFPLWNHVSGVLLFSKRFWVGYEAKEWIVTLLVNPSADYPLPAAIKASASTAPRTIRFDLTGMEDNPNFDNSHDMLYNPHDSGTTQIK